MRSVDGTIVELVAGDRWLSPSEERAGGLLDLSGLWSMSGLADAHAHLAQDQMVLAASDPEAIRRRAFAYLEAGVFLCLDKGWSDRSVLTLLDRPPTERPEIQSAGRMISSPGGYYPGFAVEVGEEDLADLVADEAAHTAGWVKLVGDWPRRGQGAMTNFGEQALARAVDVAHRAGCRVAIHTMAPGTPSLAVRAGVDSIEHGLFLTDDDVRALGARGGAWVPTVLRVEMTIDEIGRDRTGGRLLSEGLDRVRSLLPLAAGSGVAVLSGSDLAVPSSGIGAEAMRLAAMGLPVEQALDSVSAAVHRHAGISAGFEPGRPADLVAFDRNPHDDLAVLTDPALVMRNGQILYDAR